jgi:hypothetical protein
MNQLMKTQLKYLTKLLDEAMQHGAQADIELALSQSELFSPELALGTLQEQKNAAHELAANIDTAIRQQKRAQFTALIQQQLSELESLGPLASKEAAFKLSERQQADREQLVRAWMLGKFGEITGPLAERADELKQLQRDHKELTKLANGTTNFQGELNYKQLCASLKLSEAEAMQAMLNQISQREQELRKSAEAELLANMLSTLYDAAQRFVRVVIRLAPEMSNSQLPSIFASTRNSRTPAPWYICHIITAISPAQ